MSQEELEQERRQWAEARDHWCEQTAAANTKLNALQREYAVLQRRVDDLEAARAQLAEQNGRLDALVRNIRRGIDISFGLLPRDHPQASSGG